MQSRTKTLRILPATPGVNVDTIWVIVQPAMISISAASLASSLGFPFATLFERRNLRQKASAGRLARSKAEKAKQRIGIFRRVLIYVHFQCWGSHSIAKTFGMNVKAQNSAIFTPVLSSSVSDRFLDLTFSITTKMLKPIHQRRQILTVVPVLHLGATMVGAEMKRWIAEVFR